MYGDMASSQQLQQWRLSSQIGSWNCQKRDRPGTRSERKVWEGSKGVGDVVDKDRRSGGRRQVQGVDKIVDKVVDKDRRSGGRRQVQGVDKIVDKVVDKGRGFRERDRGQGLR